MQSTRDAMVDRMRIAMAFERQKRKCFPFGASQRTPTRSRVAIYHLVHTNTASDCIFRSCRSPLSVARG